MPSERGLPTKQLSDGLTILCAQVVEVTDNINDKDKENNNGNINFTWKEIDDPNKKSRGGLFSFIKRKTAEISKAIEKSKAEKAAREAKPSSRIQEFM